MVNIYHRLSKLPWGVLTGGTIVISLLIVALFAPWLTSYDPNQGELAMRLQPPSAEHWLGTDHLGRDLLSRLIYGARTTLLTTIIVTIGCLFIGAAVGLTAGYLGGQADNLLMRLVDLLKAFPSRILAMVVVGIIGPGLFNLALAVVATWWVAFARLIRGITLSVRENEYVLAARMAGRSTPAIIYHHILPNVLPQILVVVAFNSGWIMMALAGFSLLGLGVQPPAAEWGMMISEARPYFRTNGYLLLFPGLAIMLAVTGFTLLGEGFRDYYDPRMKGGIQ